MSNRLSIFAMLVILLSLASMSASGQDLLAQADAAFNAGRHDEALRLYDETLEADPSNLRALIQSGKLLSWSQRFEEAIERYERALAVDPAEETARLERAKVLSWSGRYDAALEAFEEILRDDPDDVNAQLGVARVKSWSGNQSAARAEYQKILDRDPENISAMVGVAQTYAWSGEEATARDWYDAILAADPAQRSALLGTAYLDLSAGDRHAAEQKALQLEERFPDDDEIVALREAIDRSAAPTYQLTGYHIEDTDDNEVDRYGVQAGFSFPRRVNLDLGYYRYELTNGNAGTEGRIDNAYVSLLLRPTVSQRLMIRGGVDQLESTTGESQSEPTGMLVYTIGAGSKVTSTLVAERRSLRYTTTSLDQGILIDAYSGSILFRPSPSWSIQAGGGLWDVSDGNERTAYDAELSYRWPLRSWRVSSDYQFRFFDYDLDLDNGYFDPDDFTSHSIRLNANRDFAERFYVNGSLETGIQSFTLGTIEISDDQFLTSRLLLGVRLTPELAFEIQGTASDAAVQSATGFESDELFARIRWQPRR